MKQVFFCFDLYLDEKNISVEHVDLLVASFFVATVDQLSICFNASWELICDLADLTNICVNSIRFRNWRVLF